MEAAGFFAALVVSYQTNWHEIPEGNNSFKRIKQFANSRLFCLHSYYSPLPPKCGGYHFSK